MLLAVTLGSAAMAAGCSSRHSTASASPAPVAIPSTSTQPTSASLESPAKGAEKPKSGEQEVFEDPAAKVKLKYPAGWKKRDEPENVLSVSPKPEDAAAPELSLAVPKLPFHLPGMIPLGAVKNGYFDDLKKRFGDLKEDECPPTRIAGASGVRRFIVEGKDKKLGDRKLDVLLITRGDILYVVSSESSVADFETAHSAMDGVVSSLEWMK